MENIRTSKNGYRLDAELKNVPVAFVNGLRRLILAELPIVVLSGIEILENSSSMTHEMLRHRIRMLPVNVRPEDGNAIRTTKLELNVTAPEGGVEVTSDDFTGNVILKDRDLGTPLLFLRLKEGESVHIKATLAVVHSGASHVCVSTFQNHIDQAIAKADLDTYVAQAGEDVAARKEAETIFKNFHVQRSFSRNKETGRPDWFDFTVESVGVVPAKDLVKKAVGLFQEKIDEFVKCPVLRESDGWYRVEMPGETYTVGQLMQEIIYMEKLADFVSTDIGHPLVPKLTIRFHNATTSPDAVLSALQKKASALCENVLKSV